MGGETFLSVVLRDITHRKSVEAALERAMAARELVLGIVAHDLRNPLSAIMMDAKRDEASPGQRTRPPQSTAA